MANATMDWLLQAALAPDADDELIRPLYEAAARRELRLPRCLGCDLPLELEQQVCDRCGCQQRCWAPVEPVGVVHSSTLMHRREPGLVRAEHPYPIVDVELASGHRIVMTTTAPCDSAPPIGAAVRVGYRHLGGVVIPAIDTWEDHA
ncbi:Zn-ribbon domain-containing OB-fold protein [Mycobacterium xenopi]|nr:OB-fold domain-containing protein [Mycobacterium xenopi]MDA3639659.1 OB-fold domain-containing protein [Mycobacterium xenopi]MDA3657909.1 OB-fold domain-containing protein [Mycobacterium xenopi]MDA3663574.1 OB-fold domain-containing protein [Mycobacterium xenopi]ORX21196.1 3-ketoacyl-CoA thiolase [Mycobacterium xenopi]